MAYRINEAFCSIQGEGLRAGTLNTFLRFSGCNLQCDMEPGPKSPGGFHCDTEFVSGTSLDIQGVMLLIESVAGKCKNIICTGGEPLLQLDDELCAAMKAEGYFIAVETNGTLPIPDLVDFVVVSPKTAEHTLKAQRADELRYVRSKTQSIPRPSIECDVKYLSPAFYAMAPSEGVVDHCVELIRENPEWRLSLQTHKLLNLR